MDEKSEKDLLGIGVYSTAEAARYARISTQMLSRWLFGNRSGKSVVQPQMPDPDKKIVTFQDFVQALAIRSIRSKHNISLQKIRDAVNHARKTYKVEYPFAMPHRTFLFGDEIVIRIGDNEGDDLVQVSGKGKDQRIIREVAELYMEDIHFEGDRPVKYDIFEHSGRVIEMDPKVHFGQPRLRSGYTADALINAFQTEGTVEAAADVMGVSQDDIKLALRFDDFLQTPAKSSRAA